MSDLARQLIPILFMYGCVSLLVPFIAFAMYLAFDGDRDRSAEVLAATTVADPVTAASQLPATQHRTASTAA